MIDDSEEEIGDSRDPKALGCVQPLMDYQSLAILFLLIGFTLIVAEIFLPSGGMILILCLIAFVASFWCAQKAWYGTNPLRLSIYIGAVLMLIPTVVIGSFQIFPRTPMGRRLMGAPTTEEVTPYAEQTAHLTELIGHVGKAVTPLIPGGMVEIDGERLHAFSQGVLIDPGVDVEVLDVRGTRVLVREAIDVPPIEPVSKLDSVKDDNKETPTPNPSAVFLTDNVTDDAVDNVTNNTDDEDESKAATPLDFDVPPS